MKNSVFSERISEDRRRAFLLFAAIVPLVLMIAGLFDGILGKSGTPAAAIVISVFLFVLVLVLRRYELAVVMLVSAHIYIDWYLGLEIAGIAAAVGLFLLFVLFLRSSEYRWVTPRALWLWAVYLVLGISPALRGAQGRYELAFYYPNIFFGALLMFWLGMLVAGNRSHLKTLFQLFALMGTLFAIHTFIESKTGIFLFKTENVSAYLTQVSNFGLAGSDISRAGSLLLNPDWNGTFFATLLFLPLGLFVEASLFMEKVLYGVAILLISLALFATYSIGAWIAVLVGILVFVLFAGQTRYLILIPLLMVILGIMAEIVFPVQIGPTCIKLRIVIVAHRGLANSSKCYSCLSFDGDWPGSHELSPARRSLQSPRSISSFSASAQFISRAGCYGGPSCPNRVSCTAANRVMVVLAQLEAG